MRIIRFVTYEKLSDGRKEIKGILCLEEGI